MTTVKHKRYTREEYRILVAGILDGLSLTEIGDKLGRTAPSPQTYATLLNLPLNTTMRKLSVELARMSEDEIEQAIEDRVGTRKTEPVGVSVESYNALRAYTLSLRRRIVDLERKVFGWHTNAVVRSARAPVAVVSDWSGEPRELPSASAAIQKDFAKYEQKLGD